MSLPIPFLEGVPRPLAITAAALGVPLLLGSLVYLDARRRRRRGRTRSRGQAFSRSRSLTPLAWGATTFFSGLGCVLVAACYLAVRGR